MNTKKAGEFLYKYIDKIELAVVAIGILLLFNRVFYGVGLLDETWYVAEPYIVANGAIPYLNNWTQVPGFTLPLALAYKVFLYFNGSTEGIMLFSRLLYATWITLIMILSVYIIRRNSQNFLPCLAIVPLIFCEYYCLYDICYNTIGIVYTFLVFAIVFFAVPNSPKYGKVLLILSGVIFARAITGTPYLLFTWVFLTGWFLIRKQFKEYLLFFTGNVLAAIMVIGWVCWQGSFNEFLSGMQVFLFDNTYLKLPHINTTYYKDFKHYLRFFTPTLEVIGVFFILQKIKSADKFSFDISFDDKKIYSFNLKVLLLILFVALGGMFKLRHGGYDAMLWAVRCSWALPFLLLVGEKREQVREILKKVCVLDIICALFYVSTTFNIFGYWNAKVNWLFISVTFSIACLFLVVPKTVINRILLSICMFVWAGVLVKVNYGRMYEDVHYKQCTAKVESGIWKGLYTVPDRAKAVVELENYIRSITSSEDEVMYLDWTSFGYLMTDAKACTPSALEGFSHFVNYEYTSERYKYFMLTNKVPNKIIYVDFRIWDDAGKDRNKGLSIDKDWKFNKFVNKYYDLQEVYHTKHNVVEQYGKDSKIPKDKKIIVKYYKLKGLGNMQQILENLEKDFL